MAKSKDELYAAVTTKIVESLEAGASPNHWSAPWHATAQGLPENVASHKAYRGVNVFTLWAEQQLKSYSSPYWGTYRQWKSLGAQVKKRPDDVEPGAWGTTVLLWKPSARKTVRNDDGSTDEQRYLFTTSYTVFNADQVNGWEPPVVERKEFEIVEHAQRFFASLGADVRHGGDRAYYFPTGDRIQLPLPEDFVDNVSYYAVSAHEHTHWTAHEKRCNRNLEGRFGSQQYAAEELIAELGSAYVCAYLGLTAASKAQQAVDWLIEHAGEVVLTNGEKEVA